MNSVIPLSHTFLPLREYIVTFYDLKGRTILSRTVKSSVPALKPDRLAPPLTNGLSRAVYLVQVKEKGKNTSLQQQRLTVFWKNKK
jgi:hypothetical protein